MVVRLLALRTGRLYPPGDILGTHLCWRLSRCQGYSGAGRSQTQELQLATQYVNQMRHHSSLSLGKRDALIKFSLWCLIIVFLQLL